MGRFRSSSPASTSLGAPADRANVDLSRSHPYPEEPQESTSVPPAVSDARLNPRQHASPSSRSAPAEAVGTVRVPCMPTILLKQEMELQTEKSFTSAASKTAGRFLPRSRPLSPRSGSKPPRNKIHESRTGRATLPPTAQPEVSAKEGTEVSQRMASLDIQMFVIEDSEDMCYRPPPSALDSQVMYMSVLKKLLGVEMRTLVRDELKSVLANAQSPALAAQLTSAGQAQPQNPLLGTDLAATAEDQTSKDKERAAGSRMTSESGSAEQAGGVGELMHSASLANFAKVLSEAEESEDDPLATWPRFARSTMQWLQCRFEKFGTEQAPAENQPRCLKRFVEGFVWGATVNVVILLHIAFMVYGFDYRVLNYTEKESMDSWFFWVDVSFLVFYTVEFVFKFALYRWYYFKDVNWKSNWFDFVLLASSMQSMLFTIFFGSSADLSALRLLRLLRLLKAFRVLRLAAHFPTMRAIMTSLMTTFSTLLWSLLTLLLVYFVFSLVFVSRVAAYLESQSPDLDQWEVDALMESFGSVLVAMESLVMSSSGGKDWGEDYLVIGCTGEVSKAFYLFFIFFIQVALMNIILGIFVDDAMKALLPDVFERAHELALEEKRIEEQLQTICADVDLNGSGLLNVDEWNVVMRTKHKRELLEMLGLRAHHVHQYFSMTCENNLQITGQANVDIKEFIDGCMRLRGSASPFDIMMLQFEILSTKKALLKDIKDLMEPGCSSS